MTAVNLLCAVALLAGGAAVIDACLEWHKYRQIKRGGMQLGWEIRRKTILDSVQVRKSDLRKE